ncbi:MAG TPA: hypothetical protein VL383_16520 [Gemmatimonadaceae bacterium]|nr:hypothetical protein [Gemmatimonadaceae bacterium]
MLVIATRALLAAALVQGWSSHPVQGTSGISPADSQHVVRGLQSTQRSFESFRRSRLPVRERGSGPCDIHVGRYCYWRGDDDDDDRMPEEAAAIRARRTELIRSLDSAATLLEGDTWVAGQLVRYLVEAGRTDDAIRFTRDRCRSGAAWCAALAGYASHIAGRFAAADSAYEVALSEMPPAERCRWLDVSDLLANDLAHRYDAVGCDGRDSLTRRILWLGAPLYSVAATDLFTEHLARFTRVRMAEHSAEPDGESWGDDVRELMLRYGWPRWYSRSEPPMGSQMEPSITGHDAGMPYDFIPRLHALDHIGHVNADDWTLDDGRAPTGYAPSFARSVHDLPGQIATFRRGDSALVVAAWDVRRDTTLLGRRLQAALVLASPACELAISRDSAARTVGRLWTTARLDSGLVSLELLAPSERRAARLRVGLPARDTARVALSDLLLFAVSGAPSNRLELVRDSALATNVISGARGVGVYWETYGLLPSAEPLHFTLRVEQFGAGWFRRTAERLHLADPTSGLRLQWDEVPEQVDGRAARGLRLDLSRLRAGRYRVSLTARAHDGTATTVREIEVR